MRSFSFKKYCKNVLNNDDFQNAIVLLSGFCLIVFGPYWIGSVYNHLTDSDYKSHEFWFVGMQIVIIGSSAVLLLLIPVWIFNWCKMRVRESYTDHAPIPE